MVSVKDLGGDPTVVKTRCGVHLAANSENVWPLTSCCQATGKGWMDDDTGQGMIVCRCCFEEVDSTFGDVAKHDDRNAIRHWIEDVTDNCPSSALCAHSVTRLLARKFN